jgi:HTH-type transcriptional regulator/antitoxin HigA
MATRQSAEVFPPGVFVEEEIEERGWSQADLAEIIGRPVDMVKEIIAGERDISAEIAMDLAAAFGTSPELWINLDTAYKLSQVSNDIRKEITYRANRVPSPR